ncbi:ATP-dependent DNA helicase [Bacillus salacetis]|uniref:ATP-dependent DNA helicase n=1 Tax=Bacillus salacetis TaxID=2315464 RepID=A0A3A1QWQ5_9BACI|nr:ATP-dependent DNA helicase [Bacillus salacetis]RIW33097.1 ATP-dependent DNA helicase [Bacillus salacetis]
MRGKIPFALSKEQSFYEGLGDWIGDVFYDLLPEKGFELRDEQIYMAFQVLKAYKDKKVMFAEAGVGTGKTLVYLLYALAYARYTGKPAIIACADETLIEQIVKKEGDIRKIEQALNLEVDVRLAKSREQYLCLQKLEGEMLEDDKLMEVFNTLPEFVHGKASMTKYHRYGDRKEYSQLTDREWEKVGWDNLQDCMSCSQRHRCGQTLNRDHYREAADLIVCSHDFYMEHIWTKDSRVREGQLPLLPQASSVIFDEGHLLEFASQKALTYRIKKETLESLLEKMTASDMRENTMYLIEDIITQNEKWFHELNRASVKEEDAFRLHVKKTDAVMSEGRKLIDLIEKLTEELVFESEMYVMDEYLLKVIEEYLEQILYSLKLFLEENKGINWLESSSGNETLVIMPRLVEEILRRKVFNQKIPFIFSSATLSNNKDFSYLANSLGIDHYESFSVESPFEYEEKMAIDVPVFTSGQPEGKSLYSFEKIVENEGKTLVLFSSQSELEAFKHYLQDKKLPYPVYFEGDEEISLTVERFQNEVDSVLCSYHLWEGLDIPGESLSQVLIYSLPFPPKDPVFDAKRNHAADPFEEVDLPYMLLRLKQGIGRLIRTTEDEGKVAIMLKESETAWMQQIKAVLPF